MYKPRVGISIGDINGIGPEVIIKTLRDERVLQQCTPVIYGSSKVISYHKNIVDPDFHFNVCREVGQATKHKVNVFNCWQDAVNIELGQAKAEGGQFAAIALEKAVLDLKNGAQQTCHANGRRFPLPWAHGVHYGYPRRTRKCDVYGE